VGRAPPLGRNHRRRVSGLTCAWVESSTHFVEIIARPPAGLNPAGNGSAILSKTLPSATISPPWVVFANRVDF
jgi:hypothetical protein